MTYEEKIEWLELIKKLVMMANSVAIDDDRRDLAKSDIELAINFIEEIQDDLYRLEDLEE